MTESIKACQLADLADGGAVAFTLDDRAVAIIRVGDTAYAIDDTCSHAKVSLADGIVDADELTLECPKHGALFSLESGAALTLPATRPVASHAVTNVDGDVHVTIASPE